MDEVVLVTTTTSTRGDADRLARLVVEQRLAACAQVLGPIRSTYRWQGAVEEADELLVSMKTTAAGAAALVDAIAAHHPYEVPEVVVTPVVGGHPAYLAWVDENVGAEGGA